MFIAFKSYSLPGKYGDTAGFKLFITTQAFQVMTVTSSSHLCNVLCLFKMIALYRESLTPLLQSSNLFFFFPK